MVRYCFILICAVLIASCQSTSTGIGIQSSGSGLSSVSGGKSIDVLLVSFKEAASLAFEAMNQAYPGQVDAHEFGIVRVRNRSFFKGDADLNIVPILVKDVSSGKTGYIYKTVAEGIGSNFSFFPGYMSSAFFGKLGPLIRQRNIPTAVFSNYVELEEKVIVESVPPSIPTSFDGFVRYLDTKRSLSPFEGIWEFGSGMYVLGLYADETSPRFPYKAFVIESGRPLWRPGEIKIEFKKLDRSGIAFTRMYAFDKTPLDMTFDVSADAMLEVQPLVFEEPILLLKTYPRGPVARGKGSGTGWYIGDGRFVTNEHVVRDARSITLHIQGEKRSGRAIVVDPKLDLAVVEVDRPYPNIPVIPIDTSFEVGETVYAIGYPLAQVLGTRPKITDGILSSDAGIGSDPTNFTISVPVQPGNSGGPLLDEAGNAIGVIASKLKDGVSSDGDVENTNYAVKASYLMLLLQPLGISISPNTAPLPNVCSALCDAVVPIFVE